MHCAPSQRRLGRQALMDESEPCHSVTVYMSPFLALVNPGIWHKYFAMHLASCSGRTGNRQHVAGLAGIAV